MNAPTLTQLRPRGLNLASYKLDRSYQSFFRFREVGDKVIISNYEGEWLGLTRDEFKAYAEGTVAEGSAPSSSHRSATHGAGPLIAARASSCARVPSEGPWISTITGWRTASSIASASSTA